MTSLSAQALREDFDRSFAEPVVEPPRRQAEFLLLNLERHAYGVRATQVATVLRHPVIRTAPLMHPAGLGLLAYGGEVYVALSLAKLCGERVDGPEPHALICKGSGVALLVSSLQHVEARANGQLIHAAAQAFELLDIPELLAGLHGSTTETGSQ